MHRFAPLLALLSLLAAPLLGADEPADVVVSGESRTAAARLTEARKLIVQKKWREATTLLASINDTTEFAALPNGRFVQARLEAQRRLSRLPPRVLDDYRRRAEPQAKRWLQQGLEESDVTLLTRVVEESFCTRSAMEALDRLGDLAFERGRFAEAELWWSLLAPRAPGDGEQLRYPDPPAELAARVKAKQLLARLFAGRWDFEADLAAYRKAHPKAEGRLAGNKGLYADAIEKIAKERAARPAEKPGDWLTFGGNESRQAVLPAGEKLLDSLAQLARGGPAWRFDLEGRKAVEEDPALPPKQKPVDAARRQAFHPVVVGDKALVADARYVTAYDLRTGKAETLFDLADHVKSSKTMLSLPAVPDLRYTLTVADDVVYARLGCQSVRDVRPDPNTKQIADGSDSVLAALSLKGEKRWLVKAIDPSRKEYAVFEGAPVAARGRVWIAASRFEGDKLVTSIHCYPSAPDEAEPAPLWRTEVCQTRELLPAGGEEAGGQRRHRLHLLTLAGPRVVYCSHSGVIVGLDARTGRRAWALRYKRRDLREPEDEPALRELAPCLFADGRVYAAPADSDSVYCLDPINGEVIWQRERMEVVSLLGVAKGRLIFTTYKNPRQGSLYAGGLRAVSAEDGGDENGWELPDDGGGLTPLGRGLLIGDLVLWPTGRSPCGVVAVRQEDGRQPDNPSLLHRVPSGNLVYANGCLIVSGQRTMWAFVPPEKLDEPEEKVAAVSPRVTLRLARAAAARKQYATSVERYDAVLKMTDAADRFLREARRERQVVMLAAADEAMRAKKKDEARKWLSAALKDSTGRAKLDALVRSAELWESAGDRDEAVRAWKAVRGEDGMVEDANGLPQRAARVASQRLKRLDPRSAEEGVKLSTKAPPPAEPLTLPLRPLTTLELPAGERFVPFTKAGEALAIYSFADKGELVCRASDTGEVRWRSALPFDPTWISDLGALVLAAAPDGIAAFASNGERAWLFRAPEERIYPHSRSAAIAVPREVRPGGELSHFVLVGHHLVFVQGGHTLFAVNVPRGEVLWKRRPIDAGLSLPAPYGMIHHVVAFGDDTLLVQASGRRWLLSASTGNLLSEARDPVEPWPRAPTLLPDGGALVVADNRRVERLGSKSLKPAWTFTPSGKTTRSGGPPLAVSDGKRVVIVVPENLGLRLVGLDARKGGAKWSKLVEGDPNRLSADGWAIGERLYGAEVSAVRAWSLDAGKQEWTRLLPGDPSWRLSVSGKTLLAWPARTKALALRFRRGEEAVQLNVGPWPEEEGVLPLWCLDESDGEPIQRLNLPCERPGRRVVRRSEQGGLFPTFEAGFAADDGPSLWTDGRRLVFGLCRTVRVWDNDEAGTAKK